MRITWVNHASYVMETSDVRLITDPWITGTAFDGSWALISESHFSYEDFADISHIWISHEHSDHFRPGDLRRVPQGVRDDIVVLYQKTRDRKVVDYCSSLGFRVGELEHNVWRSLSTKVRVKSCAMPNGDSWLYLEDNGYRVLNLNDCPFNAEYKIYDLRRKVGEIDILLTKFFYANWEGNPDDVDRRKSKVRKLLSEAKMQTDMLGTKFVVLFANFSWFCRKENLYLNACIDMVDGAFDYFRRETSATPIVLYPGDTWDPSEAHDCAPAIKRYRRDLERLLDGPELVKLEPAKSEDIFEKASIFIKRLKEENAFITRNMLEPLDIYVVDFDQAFELSLRRGLREIQIDRQQCDIEVSSRSLLDWLSHRWGGENLRIGGCFRIPPNKDFRKVRKYFYVANMNNRGLRYPFHHMMREGRTRYERFSYSAIKRLGLVDVPQ